MASNKRLHEDDLRLPLQGQPERRLAKLLDIPLDELWERYDRINIFFAATNAPPKRRQLPHHSPEKAGYTKHSSLGDEFDVGLSRRYAEQLALEDRYEKMVLLGLGVARAVLADRVSRTASLFDRVKVNDRCECLVFPHPSGVSHFWNDKDKVKRAGEVLREFVLG